jgi:hypothetical protein
MSAVETLPTVEEASRLLSDLLGKNTTVKAATGGLKPGPRTPCLVAVFNRDDGLPGAVWVCDIPLAARLGAGLTMIPKGTAEESIKKSKLSDAMLDNCREVMNVASRLFNDTGAPHTRLAGVLCTPPDTLPAPAASLLAKPAAALHLDVNVDGYGPGRASIIVAD